MSTEMSHWMYYAALWDFMESGLNTLFSPSPPQDEIQLVQQNQASVTEKSDKLCLT